MIFNLSQGGESTISVTAPSGANISATCSGETVSGTGTCSLKVHVIGRWQVVCTLNNQSKTEYVEITSFGQTKSVSFSYSSTITVTTHAGATVTAVKSGVTRYGTEISSGKFVITIPAGDLGTWRVTANNGQVSDYREQNVSQYDRDYPLSILTEVPDIEVVINGVTTRYKGAAQSNSNIVISPVGLGGWKFWMYASGTVKFNRLPSNVDICIIGKGGNGGSRFSNQGGAYGGGGGAGGAAVNRYTKSLSVGTVYNVTIDSSGSYFGNVASAGNGMNGGSPSGGASGGNSGSGDDGEWVNDHSWPYPTSGGGGDGGNGVYAFDNSASFDGVLYAYGGGGGHHSGGSGITHNTRGSGGGGAGGSYGSAGTGLTGALIMRNA